MITLEHPLDEASRAFLKSVEEFAQKEVAPVADEWDHDEKLPREIFIQAGKIGLMGMIAPKEFGGRGLSYVTATFAIKELGKVFAALSMDIAAHNSLAIGQINQFGTAEQKQKFLPKLTTGEWLGAWALTEPNAGSDTAELRFENAKAELLGARGRGREQALSVLDRGRIGIAALAVGIAEAAFDRANSYANERKQFGHPIGDFQAVQWMLVDSAMELEAAEVLTMHAANLQDQAKNTTKESAMAKLFASESAVRICDRAMQIHGGY